MSTDEAHDEQRSSVDDRLRAWVDGPPTARMIRLRDQSMEALTPEAPGRWRIGHQGEVDTLTLAQGAWESGWDAAVLALFAPDRSPL